MPSKNVTVIFEGLMLFCRPQVNNQYCEVGILSNAPVPQHRVRINVFKADGQTELPASAAQLPHKVISHAEIRLRFDKLALYKGNCAVFPDRPANNSITPQLGKVLDIQGTNFYDQANDRVDLGAANYKPSIFITTGTLSGERLTNDNQFCRLDEPTMQSLGLLSGTAVQPDSQLWALAQKIPLRAFAREVKATITLAEGESLVLRGRQENQLLFCLPHPSVWNEETYQVRIENLDDHSHTGPAHPAINCPAFMHHSRAFIHQGRENYGLFLFNPFSSSEEEEEQLATVTNTTDDACCLCSQGGNTPTVQPDGKDPWS